MKRASGQWLESAEMDLGSMDQIIRREGVGQVLIGLSDAES